MKLTTGVELPFSTACEALNSLANTQLAAYEIEELQILAETENMAGSFERNLKLFCLAVDALCLENYKRNFGCTFEDAQRIHGFQHSTYTIGQKFAKICAPTHGSIFCFVEIATGNIYKAASAKAPAKHVRGNILDENGNATSKDVTPYGAAYLK